MAKVDYVSIEDFILSKQDVYMSYDFMTLYDKIENGIFASYNVLNDYLDDIKKLAVDVTLTDEMYNKYQYKPKLLCYDIYGYKELYFIILVINEMVSVKDFTKKKIKMLYTEDMNNLITHLIKAEKEIKDRNTEEVKNKVVG